MSVSLRPDWPEYGLRLAEAAALRSEDPHRKVGTCLLRADNTVAALGYNGAPSGVDIDWSDRDARRAWVIHAEANALRYVTPGEVATVVTTTIPCVVCVLSIASYGIEVVYFRDELDWGIYDRDQILAVARESRVHLLKLVDEVMWEQWT